MVMQIKLIVVVVVTEWALSRNLSKFSQTAMGPFTKLSETEITAQNNKRRYK